MGSLSRRDFGKLCSSAALFAGAAALRSFPAEARTERALSTDSLTALTLTEASEKIRSRSVTSTQLTQAVIDRIGVYGPKLNCYITVMGESALRRAAELDAELKAGKLRSPLHGIPIALKDNIDTAGVRTTAASGVFATRVPKEDADIVNRLRDAGAVIIGKTNLHEFAMGCTGDISYFGPTRNPWALDHVTGGSSSGSGSAVAADLCFGALGTDTAGSIRAPSAWCGIVGMKPTSGLVSIRGIIPCVASLDHCGPMTRTVEDLALMLTSMAGYDNLDILSVPHEAENYVDEMKQPVSGFRLAAPQEFYDHLSPEVSGAVSTAIELLGTFTAGVHSHESMPALPEGRGSFQVLGDTASYHEELVKNSLHAYMPPTGRDIEAVVSNKATSIDSARAHDKLALIRRTVDAYFRDIDLVIVPTTRGLPPTINASLKHEMKKDTPVAYDAMDIFWGCTNTSPFDAYGIPALTLPCGFSPAGLPIGLMIAGPHFSEGKILALAYAYQRATNWHKRRPDLTQSTPVPPIVES